MIDSYVKGEGDAGAIVAQADGPILNCYNTGTVVGRRAGGICGDGITSSAIRCWNSGTVTGTYEAGGIMGESVIGTSLVLGRSFEYCYNKGTVTAVNSTGRAGGIVGDSDAVWISNCYNEGSVFSQMGGYAGGLAGNIPGTAAISGIIEHSYNVGSVTGAANRTGLIAGQANENTIFTNTYYLDDATSLRAIGQYTNSSVSPKTYENNIDPTGTAPLTAAQMQVQSSFTGWDFTEIWSWAEAGDEFYPYAYPILRPGQTPPDPSTLVLITLGGAARFDKTAIRFGAALSFEAIMLNSNVGDVIDYGFHINGIDNGTLISDNWIKLSAASTEEGYTGLVWTEEMAAATTTEQLITLVREAGVKVYSCDDNTVIFAIIIDNLPLAAQDSLWVFESYLSVNGIEISQGAAKYNSVNRILEDMPSDTYDPA